MKKKKLNKEDTQSEGFKVTIMSAMNEDLSVIPTTEANATMNNELVSNHLHFYLNFFSTRLFNVH